MLEILLFTQRVKNQNGNQRKVCSGSLSKCIVRPRFCLRKFYFPLLTFRCAFETLCFDKSVEVMSLIKFVQVYKAGVDFYIVQMNEFP